MASVISREQWGAAKPKSRATICGAVQKVIIHHTAVTGCQTLEECKKQVLSIQGNHMTEKNYDDIGYNFLVAADGTLFEGRGWAVQGAHTKYHNDDSVGISFMGNFNDVTPTAEAIKAVKNLLQFGVRSGHVGADYNVKGHKDFGQTECPGTNLYAVLSQLMGTS